MCCNYIKDNGEQCGRDEEPYCFQHEDSAQALSGFSGIEMETVCDECGAALKRTERLTSPDNRPRQLLFEAVVECDCSEHVLGAQSAREGALPGGWT
jgi:hypothetical protein